MRLLLLVILTASLVIGTHSFLPVRAAQSNNYCRFDDRAIAQKDQLRNQAFKGNGNAETQYQQLIQRHGEQLINCRDQAWPSTQAIWLRLYPCDTLPGRVEEILDHIVDSGYNEVYLEVFYSGQVLLPASENRTAWDSVLRSPSVRDRDLLAEAIAKGHERNLKVYAWLFSLNFGYTYAQRSDRAEVLARNGYGETNLSNESEDEKAFVDPYNPQARRDYLQMLSEVLKRQPDGVLFDYIRYPRSTGTESVVSGVKNLWIYSDAALNTLFNRALNDKGQFLIQQFVKQGYITANDVRTVDGIEPKETPPLWQGRNVDPAESEMSLEARQTLLQEQLWYLSVAHAAQGVIDFLTLVTDQVQTQGIPSGAVFFPDANRVVGQQGFDSRLQPWTRFNQLEQWHPMSYAVCGRANCIVDLVRRTISVADSELEVVPALAGIWGRVYKDRPPLEVQMEAIRRRVPQIKGVSHFAYSWQFPQRDRDRKFCSLGNN
ncbi:family 10 glycosylhydrolase [Halothece sp. PCC 7418]|uniref:family 10 glycosylhydrolase n=1 Tax=Halothece sp. (strain PCC 7418) TaxID=65093 RepID=UPI001F38C515|nr:family 10 glycosylhydrolase [Halothece sp. PCC 7418]